MEFRGSSLPLLIKCAGPLVLPTTEFRSEESVERAREAADWGTMVHHWKETGDVKHADKRTRSAFVRAILESGVRPEALWPADGEHEVEVSWRLDGSRQARYGRIEGPGWMTGHVDYVRRTDILVINDLKTAKRYYDRWTGEEVYRPDPESPQLLGYAVAVANADGYVGDIELQIDHWPKLPLADRLRGPVRYTSVLTQEGREGVWEAMERVYSQSLLPVEGVDLNPGPHCKFCPAQLACLFNPN